MAIFFRLLNDTVCMFAGVLFAGDLAFHVEPHDLTKKNHFGTPNPPPPPSQTHSPTPLDPPPPFALDTPWGGGGSKRWFCLSRGLNRGLQILQNRSGRNSR